MPMRYNKNDLVLLEGDRMGEIRFVGRVKFARGEWYGIVLVKGEGKHDGSVAGVRYFKCRKGAGIFVQDNKIKGKYKPAEREVVIPEKKLSTTTAWERKTAHKGPDAADASNSVTNGRTSVRAARAPKPLHLPGEYRISSLSNVLVGVLTLHPKNTLGDPNVAPVNTKPVLPEISAYFQTSSGCQMLHCKDASSYEDFIDELLGQVQSSTYDAAFLFVFGRAKLLQVDNLTNKVSSGGPVPPSLERKTNDDSVESTPDLNNPVKALTRPAPVLVVDRKPVLSLAELISKFSAGSTTPRFLCASVQLDETSTHGRPLDVAEDWAGKFRPPEHTLASMHFYETANQTHLRDRFLRRLLKQFGNRHSLSVEQILTPAVRLAERNSMRERAIVSSLLPKALYFSSMHERSVTGGIRFHVQMRDVPPYTIADVKYTFDEYDEDRDGKLTFKEFENALEDIHLLYDRDVAKKIFNDISAKGIDYQEFRARLPEVHGDCDPAWHRLLHEDAQDVQPFRNIKMQTDTEYRDVALNLEKKIGGLSELLKYIENKQGSWKIRVQAMELVLEKSRDMDKDELNKMLRQGVISLGVQLSPKIRYEIVRAACLVLAELAFLHKEMMSRHVAGLCASLFQLLKSRDELIMDAAYNCLVCIVKYIPDSGGLIFATIAKACEDTKSAYVRQCAYQLLGIYLDNHLDPTKTDKLKAILIKGITDKDRQAQKAAIVDIVKLDAHDPLVAEEVLKPATPIVKQEHQALKRAVNLSQDALVSPKGLTMQTLARLKVQNFPDQRPRALSSLEVAHDIVRDAFDTYAAMNENMKYTLNASGAMEALAYCMKPNVPNKDDFKKLFLKHANAKKQLDYSLFENMFEDMDKQMKKALPNMMAIPEAEASDDIDEDYEIKAPAPEDMMGNGRYMRRGALTPNRATAMQNTSLADSASLRAPPTRVAAAVPAPFTTLTVSDEVATPIPSLSMKSNAAPARARNRSRRRGGVVNLQSNQLSGLEKKTAAVKQPESEVRL